MGLGQSRPGGGGAPAPARPEPRPAPRSPRPPPACGAGGALRRASAVPPPSAAVPTPSRERAPLPPSSEPVTCSARGGHVRRSHRHSQPSPEARRGRAPQVEGLWTETRRGRDYVIASVSVQRTALRGGKRRDRLAPWRLGRRSFAAAPGLRPPAGRSLHPAPAAARTRAPERGSRRGRGRGRARPSSGARGSGPGSPGGEPSAPPARPSGAAPGGVRAAWRRTA